MLRVLLAKIPALLPSGGKTTRRVRGLIVKPRRVRELIAKVHRAVLRHHVRIVHPPPDVPAHPSAAISTIAQHDRIASRGVKSVRFSDSRKSVLVQRAAEIRGLCEAAREASRLASRGSKRLRPLSRAFDSCG